MIFNIITINKNFLKDFINIGNVKKSIEKKIILINTWNPVKNYKENNRIDSKPYGGSGGMVIKLKPIIDTINNIKNNSANKKQKIIYMSPQGKKINQNDIEMLSKEKEIIIICGKYKGIDERILSYTDYEWSIGDYILSCGELAASIIIDSTIRLIPGVIKNSSIKNNSFTNKILDYPNFTKPTIIDNKNVPNILLSGNHKKIKTWRLKQSLGKTWINRHDIIKKVKLNYNQKKLLFEFIQEWRKNEQNSTRNRKRIY